MSVGPVTPVTPEVRSAGWIPAASVEVASARTAGVRTQE